MPTTPVPTYVALHLREPVFRSYEHLIARAVSSFPAETSFPIPPGVAPTTFVANFRNAILSLKLYAWESSVITPDLREKLWSLGRDKAYAIALDTTGRCWFRIRGKSGAPNLLMDAAKARTHSDASALAESVVPWRDATEEQLEAACRLLHFKRISGPIPVEGEVAQGLCDRLMSTYDVSLVFNPATKLTIIN